MSRSGRRAKGAQAQRQSEVEAALDLLYAAVPTLECRGLCGSQACGQHVSASDAERRRSAERGVDLDAPTPDGACPALSRALGAGRCTVYAVRPMVCRVWAAASAMRCPWGCRPAGELLTDAEVLRLMLDSFDAGGHRVSGIREVLERRLDDPVAAKLIGRVLRGDPRAGDEFVEHVSGRAPHPATQDGP